MKKIKYLIFFSLILGIIIGSLLSISPVQALVFGSANQITQWFKDTTTIRLRTETDSVRVGSTGTLFASPSLGRVGIATTTPSYTLDVVGTGKISTSLIDPILYGSSAASGNLTLYSTSNATKGKILFGTSAYDEVNNILGLGTASPSTSFRLHIVGNEYISSTSVDGLRITQTNGSRGLYIDAFATTGAAQGATGLNAKAQYSGGFSTTGGFTGGRYWVEAQGSGNGYTAGTAVAVRGDLVDNSDDVTPTFTTTYNFYAQNNSLNATTGYGLYLTKHTGTVTYKYGIYSEGGSNVLNAGVATEIPLVLKGAASQSANLFEIQNSAGTLQLAVMPDGTITNYASGGGQFLDYLGTLTFPVVINNQPTTTGASRTAFFENDPNPTGNQNGTISVFNAMLNPTSAYNYTDSDNGLGLVVGRYRLRFSNAGTAPTVLRGNGIAIDISEANVTSSSQTTVTNIAGVYVERMSTGGGTDLKYTTASAFEAVAPVGTGITSYRGLNLAKSTVATNQTMILLGAGTTGNWGIYENTTYANYFAGDIQHNSTTKSQYRDSALYINSIDDGHLDLTADVSVDVHAPVLVLPVKTDTGDPTGQEGAIYVNTFDNALRYYADGAWRTAASY